jgi:hypothetical protein
MCGADVAGNFRLTLVLGILAGVFSSFFTVVADWFGSARRGQNTQVPKLIQGFLADKRGMWIDAVAGALLVSSVQVRPYTRNSFISS